MNVRLLEVDDVDGYLRLTADIADGSGQDGEGHSHAYSRSEPYDVAAFHDREVVRWATAIGKPDWRRAWGLVEGAEIVGYLQLAGGTLQSERHRVEMGMGVARSHRRRGGGSVLLGAAIAWASRQQSIDWIDLGVFSDNPGAQRLYERHGFQIVGRTRDRFRVDEVSLDDTEMTLNVAQI